MFCTSAQPWTTQTLSNAMEATAAVLVQTVVLFGNAILSSVQEDFVRHCFLHSMFQAGQHILLFMMYFSGTVLLYRFLRDMARRGWRDGAEMPAVRHNYLDPHRSLGMLQPVAEMEAEYLTPDEYDVEISAQEPYMYDVNEDDDEQPSHQQQNHHPGRQVATRRPSKKRRFMQLCVSSVCLFCLAILLQFECTHASCVLGLSTMTVGAYKKITQGRMSMWLMIIASIAALLLLGDIVKAHVGDPSGFTMADAFASIIFPMLVPQGLAWADKPKTTELLLMRSAPMLCVLGFLTVLMGLANPDPCASQHIARWDMSLQKDDDGNYIPTYRIIVEQTTVVLAIFMPMATFATGYVMTKAFVQDHTPELGSVITAAACTKYVIVMYGRVRAEDAILPLTAMYLSWVAIFCWIVWHLCRTEGR